ncbi:rhodanese-like domain-containing protein [Mycoplasma sp. Mirounga ES2805-ORL]
MVFCFSQNRSTAAVYYMQKMGFKNLYDLEGGFFIIEKIMIN